MVRGCKHPVRRPGVRRRRQVHRLHRGVPGRVELGVARDVPLVDAVPLEQAGQRLQRLAGVRDHPEPGVLDRVQPGDVDVDELHVRVLEDRPAGRGEVGVAGADADHQVGLGRDGVGGRGPGGADRTQALRVVVDQGPLARLGLADGDARGLAEGGEGVDGARVVHAAAGHDQRLPRAADQLGSLRDGRPLRQRPGHVPHPACEQVERPVVGLRLDVLRQADRHRSGLGRVGEHPHGAQQGGRQLLGAPDPVEVARDGTEAVVDRDVPGVGLLQLLQQRRGAPVGERVGRHQQHRQPVDGGERGPGHHVGRAGADAGGDDVGLQPVLHPGVGDGAVHHGLLVAAQDVRQGLGLLELGLQQGLAEACDVAVAEDAEAAGEQLLLDAVGLGVLGAEEPDHRLGDGEGDGRCGRAGHGAQPLFGAAVSRGSTSWSAQVPRTQVWSGWSEIFQARSAEGPAITFR